MKYINRQQSPVSFEQWKNRNRTANWKGFSGNEVYREVKEQLVNQQAQMCGYCETAITVDRRSSHIDHLRDRHNFPREIFNYDNFIVSCQNTESCGHKKDNNYFDGFVSPFDTDCQNRFTYTRNGRIIPSDENDENAQKTIDILGLNCRKLVNRREGIIKALEEAGSQYIKTSLDNCIDWYQGFQTVIEYMMN